MLFQEAMGVGETEVVGVKVGVGTGVTSEVPSRSASRVASRPGAESVRLELGVVKDPVGKTDGVGVAVGVGAGEGGGVGAGVGAAAILPKATGPVTVIRTDGRG